MNCNDAENVLLESLDGPIGATQQDALDTHLASCPACHQFAEAQRTLDASLCTQLQRVHLDRSFDVRVLASLSQAQETPFAQSGAARLEGAQSEHAAFLGRLQHQTSQALRRGVLDGAAAAAVGLGILLAAQNALPRLESVVAALIPARAVSPSLVLASLLALAVCVAVNVAVRPRSSRVSLWIP